MTTIEVKQEHIEAGKHEDCIRCPIALAIREVVSPEFWVHVGAGRATIQGEAIWLSTPARMFIKRFDGRYKVKPFAFDLDIPGRFLRTSQ